MLKALLDIGRRLRSAWLIEFAGACLIVAGVYEAWGTDAALIAGGTALVLKAYDVQSGDA
jgi:hypothetical protein